MMVSARSRHARQQLDWRISVPRFRLFDHDVRLPWWAATITAPIVIGTHGVVWLGAIPWTMLKTLEQWRTAEGPDAPPLGEREHFVLILRNFGRDGGVFGGAQRPPGGTLPRVRTLEEIVGETVGDLGLGSVVGLMDQRVDEIPACVRYYRTPHQSWQEYAVSLLLRSTAVVVLAAPSAPLGSSFRWELDAIVRLGLVHKAIVIGPSDVEGPAREGTYAVLEKFGLPRPHSLPLVTRLGGGRPTIYPSPGRHHPDVISHYKIGLARSLIEIVQETP